jgi:hypothetical protein
MGTQLAAWLKTKCSPGAITTMHIIHGGGALTLDTAVHELTHVAQYQKVGAVYIVEALCAQNTGAGYDYGDLSARRSKGDTFASLNREQQAEVCEDFYKLNNGMKPDFSGTKATLAPFIADMRSGAF